MVVCSYFGRGICRYGTKCRNEHVLPQVNSATSSRLLGNELSDSEVLRADLTEHRPLWIISSYSFKKNGQNYIFGDISPEEIRLEYYKEKIMTGNIFNTHNTYVTLENRSNLLHRQIIDNSGQAVQFEGQLNLLEGFCFDKIAQLAEPLAEMVEADGEFRKPKFQYGKIPIEPPPKHVC